MDKLELDDKGVYRVSTETSAYIFDLDNVWVGMIGFTIIVLIVLASMGCLVARWGHE